MAYGREVNTDLMGASCPWIYLKECKTIKVLDPFPPGDRLSSSSGTGGHPLSFGRMSSDLRIDQSFLLAELSIDDGQVDLVYRAIFELFD
jgi:hypothetical protein